MLKLTRLLAFLSLGSLGVMTACAVDTIDERSSTIEVQGCTLTIGYWKNHPEKWPVHYGDRPTWVFTSKEQPVVPGVDVRFASGDVREVWPQIREAAGERDVWIVGGGDLAGQFADAGLLDELRVSVAPATLASGKPLLPRSLGADRLELTDVRHAGAFAELTYRVTSGAV